VVLDATTPDAFSATMSPFFLGDDSWCSAGEGLRAASLRSTRPRRGELDRELVRALGSSDSHLRRHCAHVRERATPGALFVVALRSAMTATSERALFKCWSASISCWPRTPGSCTPRAARRHEPARRDQLHDHNESQRVEGIIEPALRERASRSSVTPARRLQRPRYVS